MRIVLANIVAASAFCVTLAGPAAAVEGGRADFAFVSDLAAQGYEPFAASGVDKSLFGMKKGSYMYLCYSADSGTLQAERKDVLLAYVDGRSAERDVPRIPVVCVPVQ